MLEQYPNESNKQMSIELCHRRRGVARRLQLQPQLGLIDLCGSVHRSKPAHRRVFHGSVELRAIALTDRSVLPSSSGMRQYERDWASLPKMKHAMTAGLVDGRRLKGMEELESGFDDHAEFATAICSIDSEYRN
jgi:hypothetical protein